MPALRLCPSCQGHCTQGCDGRLPYGSTARRKHCCDRCRFRTNKATDRREAKGLVVGQVGKAESTDGRASARRGQEFERFVAEGFAERVALGLQPQEAADEFGTSNTNVSRWMAAWREDELARRRQEGWVRSPEVEALLADFAAFRRHYFLDEWGKPYVTEPFHLRWIEAILNAMATGGRLQILSPPRHGKTQLLIHFCVWLIITRPNIRILWVGLNEDNAKEAVGAVLDILENHEVLISDVLGPAGSFRPAIKSGRQWSSSVFTVATREGTGIKSPTMRALGKGGKLLSKDVDLGVLDDVQDQDSVWSPASREKDRHWINTQVSSRKEDHTALAKIGSRQHHEDLDGELIENPAWDSIVEHAHDPMCTKPIHPPKGEHPRDCEICAAHVDCLLWPGKRTMWFLQDQRAALQDDVMFEMVYNNITRAVGEAYVTVEHVERIKNLERCRGDIPDGTRLIAGLDPAVGKSGHQAAVLWAYHPDTKVRHLVDIDVRVAGGPSHMREITKVWFEKYRCAEWVFEDNAAQSGWLEDSEYRDYIARNGIMVHAQTTTAQSKWDPASGVLHQLALVRQDPPQIDLPWGDEDSRDMCRVLVYQWLNFEPAVGRGVKSKTKTDVLMAAWVPETRIRYWQRAQQADIQDDYLSSSSHYDTGLGDSYVGIMGDAA